MTGTAVVESISGQIMLPRGQHIARAQIVNSITDPVRSEVLATLEFTLAAVTDDYAFYTVSLAFAGADPGRQRVRCCRAARHRGDGDDCARGKSP